MKFIVADPLKAIWGHPRSPTVFVLPITCDKKDGHVGVIAFLSSRRIDWCAIWPSWDTFFNERRYRRKTFNVNLSFLTSGDLKFYVSQTRNALVFTRFRQTFECRFFFFALRGAEDEIDGVLKHPSSPFHSRLVCHIHHLSKSENGSRLQIRFMGYATPVRNVAQQPMAPTHDTW